MREVIGITGCPAVGKKAVGRLVAHALGFEFIELVDLLKEEGCIMEEGEVVIDLVKGKASVSRKAGKGKAVIAGLYIFDLLDPELVDVVVVLRCDPRILFYRYLKRNYPLKKIRDNLTAEFLDYCYFESVKAYGSEKVSQLDATKRRPEDLARKILEIYRSGNMIVEHVDWLSLITEFPELSDLLA